MFQASLFIFGTLVGSFLNVVAMRWGTGKVLAGRSSCPSCGKTLRWYELIPIFSFLIQWRRCRNCGTKISWQYLIAEILTGAIFLLAYSLQLTIYGKLIFLIVSCIYIVILIYDFHYKIIPDPLVYSAVLLSVTSRWLSASSGLDWLAGPIIFAFFASIWLLSKGRAMGFGDAKLGLSIGLLLGAEAGFSAIILAFWIGALVSLPMLFANKLGFLKGDKELTMKSEVPFAPFIILGAWISAFSQIDLLHVSLF